MSTREPRATRGNTSARKSFKKPLIAVITAVVACSLCLLAVLNTPMVVTNTNIGNDVINAEPATFTYGTDAPQPVVAAAYNGASAQDARWASGEILATFPAGTSVDEATASLAGIPEVDLDATQSYGLISSEQLAAGGALRVFLTPGTDVEQAVASASATCTTCAFQPNFVYTLVSTAASDEDAILAALAPESDPAYDPTAGSTCEPAVAARTQAAEQGSATTPNDLYYTNGWQTARVYAPEAWELMSSPSDITVAVIDTGCNLEHEDLEGNLVTDYAYDFVTHGPLIGDHQGHGTHVTGIIAAKANNEVGIAGIGNGTKVLPVRVLDENNTCFTSSIVTAFDYTVATAAKHPELKLRVINMSIVGDSYDKAFDDKINAAKKAGIVTVCSAGNDGKSLAGAQPSYPAAYDGAVSVSALGKGRYNAPADFSNYHESVDICAPGEGIWSTYFTGPGSYTDMDGTSMASPAVAAVFALVFAVNPGLSADQAIDIVISTVDNVNFQVPRGREGLYGAGVVNAQNAVLKAQGKQTVAVEPGFLPAIDYDHTRVEGYWGTNKAVSFYITGDDEANPGQLVIYPTNGVSGTLPPNYNEGLQLEVTSGSYQGSSFAAYADQIRSIVVKPGVKATGECLEGVFAYLPKLEHADLSGLDTSSATSMREMFYKDGMLQTLDISSFDTGNVMDMGWMFFGCGSLEYVDVSGFNTSKVGTKTLGQYQTYSGEMFSMFNGCSVLKDLDVSGFDTSNVHCMQYMFYGCGSLEELDVSHFNTQNVINMSYMFCRDYSLTALDVTHFDTRNVTDMSYMFAYCESLEKLDVSKFNTQNVRTMKSMFFYCYELGSLDVSSFNVSSTINFQSMFGFCKSLRSIDLSKWRSYGPQAGYMFSNCESLESADISGLASPTSASGYQIAPNAYVFANCPKLKKITLGEIWTLPIEFPHLTPDPYSEDRTPSEGWTAASDGTAYAYNQIPVGVTDTYTLTRSITSADVVEPGYSYKGTVKSPVLEVKSASHVLTEGKDYTVSWSGNMADPGEHTATIRGVQNAGYTGYITMTTEVLTEPAVDDPVVDDPTQDDPAVNPPADKPEDKPTANPTPDNPGTIPAGQWQQDGAGWWYRHDDGTYPVNRWATIDGKQYHFNKSGYMDTNWVQESADWYFLGGDGAMKRGWVASGGAWYLMGGNGKMLTGWQTDGGVKYYLHPSGAMATGWTSIKGEWYYFNGSGALYTGWLWDGAWYYLSPDFDIMATGFWRIGGQSYLFADSGAMLTGWQSYNGKWYLFAGSGAMLTGWQNVGGTWYFMDTSGVMQTGIVTSGNAFYYMDPSGAMATGWREVNGKWYYFHPSGEGAANEWVGNYWLQSNGVMATDCKVDNDRYYVGPDGVWVPDA